MTSGKLNGILYTCTWFPKLGKYNLKNIILILIKKKPPIQSYVLCCALCSILFQNMWMFVVYQNKFRPSYIPPYIDPGFTSVSSWHRLCMQQFWSDPSTSAIKSPNPSKWARHELKITFWPLLYQCTIKCKFVYLIVWVLSKTGELLKGGTLTLKSTGTPLKKSKKTKSPWGSRVAISSFHNSEQYKPL